MTGAGAPGAAGIIACLHADPIISLTVADANEHAVGRYLNERFYQIPAASANDFIEKILPYKIKVRQIDSFTNWYDTEFNFSKLSNININDLIIIY